MESDKPESTGIYFIFHGACPDGFMTCVLMDLFRFAVHKQGLVFKDVLQQVFETSWKSAGSNFILDPPDVVPNKELRKWTGSLDKVPESGDEQPIQDIHYLPIVHTSTQNNLDRIKKHPGPKDIAIIADIGNLEVFKQLSPLFKKLYFVDHHLTSFTEGLNNPEFTGQYPHAMFFFSKPFAATQLMYNLLMPASILQPVFSQSFGENIDQLALTIAKGDVNSVLALSLLERQINAGLVNLGDFETFGADNDVLWLRKAANYDIEIYVNRGKKCIEEQDKEIQAELKKFQYGAHEYESKEAGKRVLLKFLAIQSNTKFKSELGSYLCKIAGDMGLDPVGLVYNEITSKPGHYKGSWRSVTDPDRPNVNVCELAEQLEGGGHRNAAGSAFDKNFVVKFLELGQNLKAELEKGNFEKAQAA